MHAATPDAIGIPKPPRIELQADVGFVWVVQGKACLNFNENIFGEIRYSDVVLAREYGFSAGYQRSLSNKSRMQMSLGYSRIKVYSLNPGGSNEGDTVSYWHGVIIEYNFIHYFNTGLIRIGFNASVNFDLYKNKAIPSLNAGLILGMF